MRLLPLLLVGYFAVGSDWKPDDIQAALTEASASATSFQAGDAAATSPATAIASALQAAKDAAKRAMEARKQGSSHDKAAQPPPAALPEPRAPALPRYVVLKKPVPQLVSEEQRQKDLAWRAYWIAVKERRDREDQELADRHSKELSMLIERQAPVDQSAQLERADG